MKRIVGIILFMLPFSLCGHTAEKNCDDIFILKSHHQLGYQKGATDKYRRKKISLFSPKGYSFDYDLFISDLYYKPLDKDEYHVETIAYEYEDEVEVKINRILPLSKSKVFRSQRLDGKNYKFSRFIYRYYGLNKLYHITSVKEIDQQVAKKVEACENRTLGYVRRVK